VFQGRSSESALFKGRSKSMSFLKVESSVPNLNSIYPSFIRLSVLQFIIAGLPRAVQQPINNPPIDELGRNSRGAWLSRGELVKGMILGVVEGRMRGKTMG